jgi:hypothetical protein
VFQEINPKRAVGKSVSPIAVIEATNYQIAQDKDLNKIIQYVRMAAKDNCMANGKQLVFTTNEFGNFIPISVAVAADCKTVTYSTLSTYHSETYTGIPFIATFNVKDNTVQYAPPDEKIYSDVNNGELNKYLLALTREGVLYGEEGKFHSGRPASKAEFYAMVARLFYPKDDWGQDASLGVRYKTFLESQLKQSFLSTEYTSDITYNEAADLVYRVRKHKGLEPETEKQLTDCETSLNWSKESYQLYDANILSLPKAYYKPPKIGVDIPDFTFKLCFNSSPKKEAKTAFMFPYDASMNRDQMAKLLYRAKYGKETW